MACELCRRLISGVCTWSALCKTGRLLNRPRLFPLVIKKWGDASSLLVWLLAQAIMSIYSWEGWWAVCTADKMKIEPIKIKDYNIMKILLLDRNTWNHITAYESLFQERLLIYQRLHTSSKWHKVIFAQFLTGLISDFFFFFRPVAIPWLNSLLYRTNYSWLYRE